MQNSGEANPGPYLPPRRFAEYHNEESTAGLRTDWPLSSPHTADRISGAGNELLILAQFACAEYMKSAETKYVCENCFGKGILWVEKEVVKYHGLKDADDNVIFEVRKKKERTPVRCDFCGGRGTVSARCRCKGTGIVRDVEESARQGMPVNKKCERCDGRGYKRTPSSKAYHAVRYLVPELTQSSWSRNWKPFFEKLVAKCDMEESQADAVFQKLTR